MIKNLNNSKFFGIVLFFSIITLIVVVVKLNFFGEHKVSKNLNHLFFKNLNIDNTIETIKKIQIDYEGKKLTLTANEENKWLIAEKYNFPALSSKVKEIIFGLADLKILEAKTSRPENFAELDLQGLDVNKEGTKITLLDLNDKEIDSIYIGKREFIPNPNGENKSHIFIRRPSEHQTWLVSGRLPEGFAFKDLVVQPVFPIELKNISEVTLLKPKQSSEVIKIIRNTSTGELKLLDIPARYKVKEQYMIDNILQQISYLNYDDIVEYKQNAAKVLEVQVVVVENPNNSKEQGKDLDPNIKSKVLKYHFDLVYLNNNYYLKAYNLNTPNKTESKTNKASNRLDDSAWLYKLSDYAFQSLLIEKKDLLTLMNKQA